MAVLTLTFGGFSLVDHRVLRSSLRWVVPNGSHCIRGEVLAYCNISIKPQGKRSNTAIFEGEKRDTQIALLAPHAGRLRHRKDMYQGGFHDFFALRAWTDSPFAILETEETGPDVDRPALLVMVSGRRITELAEVRSGILTGWHDRSRAFRIGTEPVGTLLAAGICDLEGSLRGPGRAFIEFVSSAPAPVQLISLIDTCLIPATRILIEQLQRTPEEMAAISKDMVQGLAAGPTPAKPSDLIFAGALLATLARSPLTEAMDTLTYTGLQKSSGPDALLLSIRSENSLMFKHRNLGYTLAFHRYRLEESGAAFKDWIHANFEKVRREADQVKSDYIELLKQLRQRQPDMKVMVANAPPNWGSDDIHSYSGLETASLQALVSFQARSQNLMLLELAQTHAFSVVDLDAVAAKLGTQVHLFDGLHGDGVMDAAVRAEILATASAMGIRGFAQN